MSAKRLPAEKRRRQILRSATAVFARRGFNGATTKQIAAEADAVHGVGPDDVDASSGGARRDLRYAS